MNWKYVGGGYFRDADVPIGKKAEVIHSPELVTQLNKEIKRLQELTETLSRSLPGE